MASVAVFTGMLHMSSQLMWVHDALPSSPYPQPTSFLTFEHSLNNETLQIHGRTARPSGRRQRCHELTSALLWSADSLSKNMSDERCDVAWFKCKKSHSELSAWSASLWGSRQMARCMSWELLLSSWRTLTLTPTQPRIKFAQFVIIPARETHSHLIYELQNVSHYQLHLTV